MSFYAFAFFISLPIKLGIDDAGTLTIKSQFVSPIETSADGLKRRHGSLVTCHGKRLFIIRYNAGRFPLMKVCSCMGTFRVSKVRKC